jgi:hypothetical protein
MAEGRMRRTDARRVETTQRLARAEWRDSLVSGTAPLYTAPRETHYMLPKMVIGFFCVLVPSLVFGQVPLPPPYQGPYIIEADGCIAAQPCAWRGWRSGTPTVERGQSGNLKLGEKRNPDRTTDVDWANLRTGSRWNQHFDPSHDLQSGHNKSSEPYSARLAPPFGTAPYGGFGFGNDFPLTVVIEPSEHDRWMESWWNRNTVQARLAATPTVSDAVQQESLEQRARELEDRHKQALIGVVLSHMRDGSIVVAARAAARQQCLKEQDENLRNACMADADRK